MALLVVAAYAATTVVTEDAKISASDGLYSDWFGGTTGQGLAFDGATIVAGAYKDDDAGTSSGSAYAFGPDGSGGWTQIAKFTASDAAAGDEFGYSVDVSGNTIVVGAALDDYGSLTDAGSVYVFTPDGSGGWTETKLFASDASSNSWFGSSVAIDGDTLVAGAPPKVGSFPAQGATYVFERDGSGAWTQTAKLAISDPAFFDWLGQSVDVSGDTVVTAAFRKTVGGVAQVGAAYVFGPDGSGGWTQTAKLTASDGATQDFFGYQVQVDGDTIVVGVGRSDGVGANSGAAYVFAPDGSGGWTETAKLTASDAAALDRFGYSVAVSGDTIVVGSVDDDHSGLINPGSAYAFRSDGSGGWTEVAKLQAAAPQTSNVLGSSVAVAGGTIVVSAAGIDGAVVGSGSALIFNLIPPNEPPVADAGPDQSIHPVVAVDLDGSGSMDDQTATGDLVFAWMLTTPAGSAAALDDAASATPSFTADLPGTYTAQLVVTDEEGLASAADSVVISSSNVGPTADAGADQVVQVDDMAVLDGGGSSDPESDPLTYAWTLDSAPTGSTAALVGATTVSPTLTPDVEGAYVVSLIVNDGFVSSAADSVEIVAIGAAFAQAKLGEACDFVAGLPDASFDAKGHRKSMCNDYAKIIKFIQKGQVGLAVAHLGAAIERVDGCTLRGMPDPKGAGQPHAADYIVNCAEQEHVYGLLDAALGAIE